MTTAIVRHGIPQELTTDALIASRKVLSEMVNSLTANTETSAKVQSEMIKSASENDTMRVIAENLVSEFISSVSEQVESDPALSAAIFDVMRDKLLPYVKDERDYWVLTTVRQNRLANKQAATNVDEIKSDFDEVRTFTVALFTTLHSMGMFTPTEDFPVKTNKAGNVVPDLPMLPRGGGSKDGRATKVRRVRWELDGEYLPIDTLPQEVIRRLFSVEERRTMTVSTFFDLFGEAIYTPNGTEREIANVIVKGWTPAGSIDSDSAEDDDNE